MSALNQSVKTESLATTAVTCVSMVCVQDRSVCSMISMLNRASVLLDRMKRTQKQYEIGQWTIVCFNALYVQLCHVCCVFDASAGCVSTFTRPGTYVHNIVNDKISLTLSGVTNATIKPGFPCANFTGYCNDEM